MAKRTGNQQTGVGQGGSSEGGAQQQQGQARAGQQGAGEGQRRSRRGKAGGVDPIEELRGLILLDLAAAQSYEIAMQACSIQEIAQQLGAFRADHERHVSELSDALRRMGGEAPEGPDASGLCIVGYTRLSALEDRSALVSMRGNEELTNEAYLSALSGELPDELRRLVESNFADEQRHIRWIEEEIRNRGWALPEVPSELARAA